MGKRISELPTVTALGDNDVAIFNHIDTSQSEPTTTTSKITVSNLKQTLGINGKIDSTEIGAAGGVAELDGNGKIPSSQLPGFVDDVVEAYYDVNTDRFYEESTFTTLIPPVSDKSWVDIAANKSYRWTGSGYVRVDEGVQLGETSGSAYRGDRGKAAYDFSQNPATATPSMDGTGAAGSSGKWAREDHVHPKDTTKADKVASATNGNFAGLDSNGNLTDSGKKPSDFVTDVSGKADKVSGATNGNVATLDASGNLSDSGKILEVSVPSTAVFTDMAGADASYNGSHGYVPAPSAGDQDKVLSGAGVWVPQSSGGAAVSCIGYEETGSTCTKTGGYSTGDNFYKNGKFCTAIATINQGATFTLNTNYVEGTIADAIKDLNSQLVNYIGSSHTEIPLNLTSRTRGYPSNTTADGTTKRTFTENTYVLGMNYENNYVYQDVVSFSILSDSSLEYKSSGGRGYGPAIVLTDQDITRFCDYILHAKFTAPNYFSSIGVAFYKSDGTFINSIFKSRQAVELTAQGMYFEFKVPSDFKYALIIFQNVSAVNVVFSEIHLYKA